MVTDEERRRVAQNLRGGFDIVGDAGGRLWLNGTLFGLDISSRSEERIRSGLYHLAGFIEPDPRAEEIAAKAYRAAADYIDWNIPDSEERVRKLREQAEELEAMARERELYDSDTTKPAADTTKCDRAALLAIADEMLSVSIGINGADSIRHLEAAYIVQGYARCIREACGVKDEP